MSTRLDPNGDRWPVTGFWCPTCRWPLHPSTVAEGHSTHPSCDSEQVSIEESQRPPRATPDDPGYCSICGKTAPVHTSTCKAVAA